MLYGGSSSARSAGGDIEVRRSLECTKPTDRLKNEAALVVTYFPPGAAIGILRAQQAVATVVHGDDSSLSRASAGPTVLPLPATEKLGGTEQ